LGTYLKMKIHPKRLRKTKNRYFRVYLDVHITAKQLIIAKIKAYFGQLWPIIGI
jgi:hypothetical protein